MEKKEMIQLIMKETGRNERLAALMAERVKEIRPELQPCVAAWMNQRRLAFTYMDITLDDIMKKESCGYIDAVFSMNTLMNNPKIASQYHSFDFRRK